MRRMPRLRHVLCSVALAAGLLLSAVPAAQADHHSVSIREVFPGSPLRGDNSEFVELQAWDANQTNFTDEMQHLAFYDSAGSPFATYGFGSDLTNTANQASALYATTEAENDFGVQADFENTLNDDHMDPAGGAVCFRSSTFVNIDCVAWGTFNNGPGGAGGIPVGTPEASPPDESGLRRSIAPGCATLLEGTYPPVTGADDSNDSATDFFSASPDPRNNGDPITESPCAPMTFVPPGNPASPINPAGNVRKRKRKCKKKPSKNAAAVAKKKRCGKKR